MDIRHGYKEEKLDEILHSLNKSDPFISKIICYPISTNSYSCLKRIEIILDYLDTIGIEGVIEYGYKRINGFRVLGKGWSSIVVLALQDNRKVVLKIRRVDSRRKTLEHEAIILEYLEHTGLAPRVFHWFRDVIVMEFIDGLLLKDYLTRINNLNEFTSFLKTLFIRSWFLDQYNIDHTELNRPLTHIIIDKYIEKPVFIDFESAKYNEKPHNATSIASYFIFRYSKRITDNIDKNHVVKILQLYKKTLALEYLLELVDYLQQVFQDKPVLTH